MVGYMSAMDKDQEIKLLKKTVKALAKMTLHQKTGQSKMPEWVFTALSKAKAVYGEDLTKIN